MTYMLLRSLRLDKELQGGYATACRLLLMQARPKMIIITTDAVETEDLRNLALTLRVPIVYSLTRAYLGEATRHHRPLSVVTVLFVPSHMNKIAMNIVQRATIAGFEYVRLSMPRGVRDPDDVAYDDLVTRMGSVAV